MRTILTLVTATLVTNCMAQSFFQGNWSSAPFLTTLRYSGGFTTFPQNSAVPSGGNPDSYMFTQSEPVVGNYQYLVGTSFWSTQVPAGNSLEVSADLGMSGFGANAVFILSKPSENRVWMASAGNPSNFTTSTMSINQTNLATLGFTEVMSNGNTLFFEFPDLSTGVEVGIGYFGQGFAFSSVTHRLDIDNVSFNVVPEPLSLGYVGAFSLYLLRRKRKAVVSA